MASDDSPEDVINRLYYAAREAALAVLAHLDTDIETMPRTHRGLRTLFYREVVEKGIMDQDWSRELANLERQRTQADYGHVTEGDIDPKVHDRHRAVVQFVEIVRELFVPTVSKFESRLDRDSPDIELGE